MNLSSRKSLLRVRYILLALLIGGYQYSAKAQTLDAGNAAVPVAKSQMAGLTESVEPESANYKLLQRRLARGWNTWDVHSVTTYVLLPEGLAIHIGIKHNTTLFGDLFLQNVLIGRHEADAEQVIPGAHTWDGSYTDARVSWRKLAHPERTRGRRPGAAGYTVACANSFRHAADDCFFSRLSLESAGDGSQTFRFH